MPEPDGGHFEEIDPDPAPARPGRGRWEAWLAGALLAAVALAGGGTWLHGALAAAAYQQGTGAQAARHWDAAQAAFAAAGTYGDAPARAAAAGGQAAYLAQTYPLLQAAQQNGEWLRAWHLAGAIAAVQPDYRDIAQQTAAAYRALFHEGAAGLIYRQPGGAQPGLTLIGPDGAPNHLPHSTAASRVLATAGDARFVYSASVDPVDPDSAVCQPGAEHLPPRTAAPRVILAQPAGQSAATTGILPASFDPRGSFWITQHGLWGTAPDGGLAYYDPATGRLQPGPALDRDTIVADAAPAGDSLLLIRALPAAGGAGQTQAVRLSPDGRMLASAAVPGFLLGARVSADGAYAALFVEDVQAGISRTLYLVDFAVPGAPARVLDEIAWHGLVLAAGLRATFVPGVPATQLLVERQDDSGITIRRYALPGRSSAVIWAGADASARDDHSALSPDGAGLAFRTQLAGRSYLTWVPVTGDRPPVVLPIQLGAGQMVDSWFAPRSDFVVYRVRNPEGLDKGTTEDVWSVAVPPGASQAPQLLATARRVYDPALPTLALPPGGALAAYLTRDGDLHVRSLDGAVTTTLASGVDAVWAAGAGP